MKNCGGGRFRAILPGQPGISYWPGFVMPTLEIAPGEVGTQICSRPIHHSRPVML
jgi:hypothetical protein